MKYFLENIFVNRLGPYKPSLVITVLKYQNGYLPGHDSRQARLTYHFAGVMSSIFIECLAILTEVDLANLRK